MGNKVIIARHEIRSLFRERTFLVLLVVFSVMTLASAYISWSSQNTINQVYAAAAEQMLKAGNVAPPSPFADYPHLSLVKNMIIYIVLIGGLLAISVGYAAGTREKKSGVVKLLFSRPVSKRDFLLGKLLAISIVLVAVMLLAAAMSAISSAFFVSLNLQDLIRLFSFYGFSWIYLIGFASLGFGFALIKDDDVVALLIPIIIWIVITFALPELTSALYPTASLNPTLPQTDILQSPTLQAINGMVYPFSISEHYKETAASILDIKTADTGAPVNHISNGFTVLYFMILCLAVSSMAMHSLDKSRW
jgi:ABC-type transport system involved in multi-copper enzyme maturation permease subunit